MPSLFTIHTAVVGGVSHYFLCKPQTYQGIENRVGVEEADDDLGYIPTVRVSQLLQKQILLRVTLYYLVGWRRRIAKVLCRPDKVRDFMFQARGLPYRGGVITSATRPSKSWRN